MTDKEYFIFLVNDELPRFKKFFEAIPEGKMDYTPHEKSRTNGSLLSQLAVQPDAIISILQDGKPSFNAHMAEVSTKSPKELGVMADTGFKNLVEEVKKTSEDVWESAASMEGPGMKWETTRRDMAWAFLLDMIHHRGQVSTYIRPMGGKVPDIYGPSGDSQINK